MKNVKFQLSQLRLTIGAKLIGLIAMLLITSITAIVYLSTNMYVRNDKENIRVSNVETTGSLAFQVREIFSTLTEKMRVMGMLLLQQQGTTAANSANAADPGAAARNQVLNEYFDKDKDYLAVFLGKAGDGGALSIVQKAISPEMTAVGDSDGSRTFAMLAGEKDFSIPQLFSGEVQIALVRLPDGSPLMALGIPFIQSDTDKTRFTHVLIAFIRQAKFAQAFNDNPRGTSYGANYMVDRRGNLIVHSDPSRVGENVAHLDVVKEMLSGKRDQNLVPYTDPQTGESKLASYKTVKFGGLGVVAEIPSAQAYEAARTMGHRSVLVGLIILFLAFWAGYLYSGTITRPIRALVAAAQRIAAGDFKINLKAKGRDEIAHLSGAFNEMAKGLEERDRVKETFNKFHNKEIAEKLLSGEVKLGGERKQATIFFSDVRGFTAMSETMEPEQVVEMLNEYMTRMVAIVRKHSGIVDKYVGDAIMALWGVPLGKEDDTYNAVRACLEMREELAKLNELRISRGQHPLKIGMGLNTGAVIAGNIGSVEKMEYTVIGDSVNLASRMESMTKEYGTDFLIPMSIYEKVKDRFIFEKCKSARVKGKSTAIEIFKVKGYIDAQGQPVIIEPPYPTSESQKSDKVVHDHSPETPAEHPVFAETSKVMSLDSDSKLIEASQTADISKLTEIPVHAAGILEAAAPEPTNPTFSPPMPESQSEPVAERVPEPSPAASAPIPPPTEIAWYLNMTGMVLGPFSSQEVENGLTAKEFPPDVLVSENSAGPWTPVLKHPAFRVDLAALPPPVDVTEEMPVTPPRPVAEPSEPEAVTPEAATAEAATPEVATPEASSGDGEFAMPVLEDKPKAA